MKERLLMLTGDIDALIKYILPHTDNFHKEIKLLAEKQYIHAQIDEMVKKCDKLINALKKG